MKGNTGAMRAWARIGPRTQILVIAAIFLAPLLLARLLLTTGWVPGGRSNHGELIEPPQQMAPSEWMTRSGEPFGQDDFMGYWNLLLVVDGACGQSCMESLDLLRRVRIALGEDAGRVHLLLLQPRGAPRAPLPERIRPLIIELVAPADQVADLLAKSAGGSGSEMGIFIIDYRAFRMMTYPLPLNASGMLEDVEQLLDASNAAYERSLRQTQDS